MNDMREAAIKTLMEFDCLDYEFGRGRKHPNITVMRNGARRVVSFSGSPSCKFAAHHLCRDLRKALKEIGYVQER
jgi:hypothetical protein